MKNYCKPHIADEDILIVDIICASVQDDGKDGGPTGAMDEIFPKLGGNE